MSIQTNPEWYTEERLQRMLATALKELDEMSVRDSKSYIEKGRARVGIEILKNEIKKRQEGL